jgi:hypothetical protein
MSTVLPDVLPDVLPGVLPLLGDELLEQAAAASAATAAAASTGASPLLFKVGILSLIDLLKATAAVVNSNIHSFERFSRC